MISAAWCGQYHYAYSRWPWGQEIFYFMQKIDIIWDATIPHRRQLTARTPRHFILCNLFDDDDATMNDLRLRVVVLAQFYVPPNFPMPLICHHYDELSRGTASFSLKRVIRDGSNWSISAPETRESIGNLMSLYKVCWPVFPISSITSSQLVVWVLVRLREMLPSHLRRTCIYLMLLSRGWYWFRQQPAIHTDGFSAGDASRRRHHRGYHYACFTQRTPRQAVTTPHSMWAELMIFTPA